MPEPLDKILDMLTCIGCMTGRLSRIANDTLLCGICGKSYPIINNVPCFVPEVNSDFSEIKESNRQNFLAAKRLAYFNDSFVGSLYNHYHKYAVSKRERLAPDSVTLDIGCGIGEHYPFISLLEKAEARFIGVDTDRFKLEYFNSCHPEVPVIQASALHLPFRDASIDVVQLLAILEHFDTDGATAVLHETVRVFKPGGHLVACYPAEGSLLLRAGQILMHGVIRLKTGFDLELEEVHHHQATAQDIQAMLLSIPGLSLLESLHFPLDVKSVNLSLFLNELYQKEQS